MDPKATISDSDNRIAMARQPSMCRLLEKLPFDIRAIIYKELLTAPYTIGIEIDRSRAKQPTFLLDLLNSEPEEDYWSLDEKEDEQKSDKIPILFPQLLATCKRIYEEALPTLYGDNTFCFYKPQCALCWLNIIPLRGLAKVHTLVLCVQVWYFNAAPGYGELSVTNRLLTL
ncbi:hypothetical protein EJ04DRAFT_527940 [Polyplosphaeria fusca]|uniref:DUF7730 domain-containing protein n=1 Tax=Polyplosphaeria fusca TaxID=682080 RepID=A0A9P4QQU7_9PLEO|nr:hypothetical protein EJ04DRAFT_527940 [Polyplosphaeria fusca]